MKKDELGVLKDQDVSQVSGGNKWGNLKGAVSNYASKGANLAGEYATKGVRLAKENKNNLLKGIAIGAAVTAVGAGLADNYLNEGKGRKKIFRKLAGTEDYDELVAKNEELQKNINEKNAVIQTWENISGVSDK